MILKGSTDIGQIVKSTCKKLHKNTFVILLIFLFATCKTTFSQNTPNDFKTIDATTYQLYMQKDWDSLILVGNEAIKNGEDYFYLRLRIGIAYYHKENYRKAASHLQKALQFNSVDTTTLEYLYYSYLFSKRDLEARILLSKFPDKLREKIKTKKYKVLDQIYIETGPTFSNNIDKNKQGNLIGRPTIGL